jgi:hypothetical protein
MQALESADDRVKRPSVASKAPACPWHSSAAASCHTVITHLQGLTLGGMRRFM